MAGTGIEIFLFGLTEFPPGLYKDHKNIKVDSYNLKLSDAEVSSSKLSKIRYLRIIPKIKKIIKTWKPDIVHAHYASSYGLIGVLLNYHPLVTSVWGTDILEFPKLSLISKLLLKFIFLNSDKLLSTSSYMAAEAAEYTNKKFEITPFGIDTQLFQKIKINSLFNDNTIVIGTVKNLEKVYGIDTLLRAFHLLKERNRSLTLKLLIVGSGTYEKELYQLASDLNIKSDTIFMGMIINDKVHEFYSMMNVAVFLSNRESFGVSALEAQSCSIPVVASNVGGFREIIVNNETGLLVPPNDYESAAAAIENIIFNKEFSENIAEKARKSVVDNFNFNNNINQMVDIYNSLLVGKEY